MRAFREVSPALRAVVTVAATSLFLVLVAWATLLGPDQVFTGPGPQHGSAAPLTPSCIPMPVETNADGTTTLVNPDDIDERDYCEPPLESLDDFRDRGGPTETPLWVTVLASLFLGTIVLGVTGLVVWLLVQVARQARVRRTEADVRTGVEFDVIAAAAARVSESIVLDADEQDALLRTGEPRNAIVAAWHRFEVQGERAGVARRSSETSSEFAIRVLDLVDADTGPVTALAELYREARFSDHPMTEEHRDRALDALAAIRRSLAVRT